MTVSTLASLAPVAAAALLTPSGLEQGFYSCDDMVRWGSHFDGSATTRFQPGYEDQRTNEFRLAWTPSPTGPIRVAVQWSRLPAGVESLPPPDKLEFAMSLSRGLRGGTVLLVPPEGELLQLPAKKPAVAYRKYDETVWVTVTDPAQLARLSESDGWRFAAIDSKGRVAAQGPINLPDRAGMQIRYRPLAESLRAKVADYQNACAFEPATEFR